MKRTHPRYDDDAAADDASVGSGSSVASLGRIVKSGSLGFHSAGCCGSSSFLVYTRYAPSFKSYSLMDLFSSNLVNDDVSSDGGNHNVYFVSESPSTFAICVPRSRAKL